MQILCRVVANLFELQDHGQHIPAPLHALAFSHFLHRIFHDGFIQRGLLLGERAIFLHLNLFRQILDDARIALDAPQDERAHQAAQPFGGVRVAKTFDRHRELAPEALLPAQEARIEELHDRPQF